MRHEFVQMIKDTARSLQNGIHTAVPGTIVGFNPNSCKATVRPAMQFKKPDGTYISYPDISGVPVVMPRSKLATIAWPVRAGDGCLIVFAEQNMQYWETGTSGGDMRFDLTNAICIPGLFVSSNEAVAKAYTENAIVIKSEKIILDGDVEVTGRLTSNVE